MIIRYAYVTHPKYPFHLWHNLLILTKLRPVAVFPSSGGCFVVGYDVMNDEMKRLVVGSK